MSTQFTNRQWRLPNNENKDKQSNYSMDFDGTKYITGGTFSEYISSTNPTTLTVSVWIKTTNTGASRGIISSAFYSSGLNFDVYNGEVSFGVSGTTTTSTTTANVNDGNWHHVVGTYDSQGDASGNTLYIYVDGIQKASNTVVKLYTRNDPLFIGASGAGSSTYFPFIGQIDGVSIFDYALSSSQVTTLYGSSSTGIGNPMSLSPKPIAYYPLGDQDAFNGANYLVPNSSLKDYVFDFDGSNDYIDCGTGLGDSIGDNYAGSLTASLWFKRSSNTIGGLINFTATGWGEFAVVTYTDFIRFGINATTYHLNYNASNGYTYDTNWHHLAVVMTPNGSVTDIKMYFDGQLLTITPSGTSPTPDLLDFAGKKLFIGTWDGATYSFNGSISNTQIFNTALPATGSNSVETLYNNGSPLTSMSGFSSLQGWWKLDASDTYDSSTGNWTIEDHAGSNDGTSSGMTQANLVQSDLSFTSGYSPYALDFDSASSDEIDCGTDSSLDITGNITLSAWINRDVNTTGVIISKWASGLNTAYMLKAKSSGGAAGNSQIQMLIRNASGVLVTATENVGEVSINKWVSVIGTYDGSNIRLYYNGVELGSGTAQTGSIETSTASLKIGSRGTEHIDGKISNASIWNTALTSSQVTELYSEGVPQNLNNHSAVSSLVSWWQLGSNSSFNSSLNQWTCIDEKGTNTGESSQTFNEDAIVDGVGSYANGLSSGMGGDEVIGDAPYSSSNSLSVNMDVLDRVTDTPS